MNTHFKNDKEGQAFIGIIMMAAGLLTLIAIFAIVPLLGYQLEQTTADIPCCANATATLTFAGNITEGDAIGVDVLVYEFDVVGDGVTPGAVEVNTSAWANNDSACVAATALALEINNHSANVSAAANCTDQGNATVVLTSEYCSDFTPSVGHNFSAPANLTVSTGTGCNQTGTYNSSNDTCYLTGGTNGSVWCPTASGMPSAISLWSTNAPLLSLVVTVSILVTIIGAIMTFAYTPGRGGGKY